MGGKLPNRHVEGSVRNGRGNTRKTFRNRGCRRELILSELLSDLSETCNAESVSTVLPRENMVVRKQNAGDPRLSITHVVDVCIRVGGLDLRAVSSTMLVFVLEGALGFRARRDLLWCDARVVVEGRN